MYNAKVLRRIVAIAAGLVLLSIVSMVISLPSILQDTSAGATPINAAIGVIIAIILRLTVLLVFRNIIKGNKRDGKINKAGLVLSGVGLLVLGLVLLDGAFAFLDDIFFVSILMFTSVFCDIAAALITFSALFLKPKKSNEIDL